MQLLRYSEKKTDWGERYKGNSNGKAAGNNALVYLLGFVLVKLFLLICKPTFLLKIKKIMVLFNLSELQLPRGDSGFATSQVVIFTVHSLKSCIRNATPTWQLNTLSTYTSLVDILPQVSPIMLICAA